MPTVNFDELFRQDRIKGLAEHLCRVKAEHDLGGTVEDNDLVLAIQSDDRFCGMVENVAKLIRRRVQLMIGAPLVVPRLFIRQGAFYCLSQARRTFLDHVIVDALLERIDCGFLADSAGEEDKGDVERALLHELERAQPVKLFEVVIRDYDIGWGVERREEIALAIDPLRVGLEASAAKLPQDQFIILLSCLDDENAKGGRHCARSSIIVLLRKSNSTCGVGCWSSIPAARTAITSAPTCNDENAAARKWIESSEITALTFMGFGRGWDVKRSLEGN
jgi:hypothetical protein